MRMSRFGVVGLTFLFAALVQPAQASLLIAIDKSSQRMAVIVNGRATHSWPVSTGRAGYATPSGEFRPFRLEMEHYSKEWDDAPMPHSIFFTPRGHAIHGSYDIRRLGGAASHGCVRLAPANAARLFALVRQEGLGNTRIVLQGRAQTRRDARRYTGAPRARTAMPIEHSWEDGDEFYEDGSLRRTRPAFDGWR